MPAAPNCAGRIRCPEPASGAVDGVASRTRDGEREQAAHDRYVLVEVLGLVEDLRGVGQPEAVRDQRRADGEGGEQPGGLARPPADDEKEAAAELDGESQRDREMRYRQSELSEGAGRRTGMGQLHVAEDGEERRDQDATREQQARGLGGGAHMRLAGSFFDRAGRLPPSTASTLAGRTLQTPSRISSSSSPGRHTITPAK